MKRINYIFFAVLLIVIPSLSSCDAMLDVDSERYTYEEDARMSSIHDTLYSMVGVLSKLQAIGDRYVLLGELRGDLMEVTENATIEMQDIYNFNMSTDNSYASMNAFYAVINQCNYIIQYADTAYEDKSDKPYMRVFTAATSIRAWTYMQMMLNFNTVPYSDKAVLSIQDTQKEFTVLDRAAMTDTLIADLLPLVDKDKMNLGFFGSYNSAYSIFPVKLLLGDLYLWKGEYAKAANMYYQVLYDNNLVIHSQYNNAWASSNDVIITSATMSWQNTFRAYSASQEVLNVLATYPKYGNTFSLDSMASQKKIYPTDVAVKKFMAPIYYLNESSTKAGDLRMLSNLSSYYCLNLLIEDFSSYGIKASDPIITKFNYMNLLLDKDDAQTLMLYRASMVYLRYAEAINRLGYSETAFAVMKYGLNSITLAKPAIVADIARVDTSYTPSYISSFVFARFNENIGTRQRGCGNVDDDQTYFIIPDSLNLVLLGYCGDDSIPTREDTMLYVEDVLLEECALEFTFEGNRFHDLMRIALRRNDPAYLADKVSAKYEAGKQAAMRAKLMNESSWYLPQ